MQAQYITDSSAIHSTHQEIPKRPIYLTVNQFSCENPAFSPSALRNLIFKADERVSTNGVIAGNGLSQAGAIIRIGRKVLINEPKFYAWVESHNRAS